MFLVNLSDSLNKLTVYMLCHVPPEDVEDCSGTETSQDLPVMDISIVQHGK
jgi:hypothetical protein